jgi:hypothetical protein
MKMTDMQRQDRERRDDDAENGHGAERKSNGKERGMKEATLLRFFIGNVHRLEEGNHAVAGAEQRDAETHEKTGAQGAVVFIGQRLQLTEDHGDAIGGQQFGEEIEPPRNRCRIGDQAVERNKCCKAGKQRQHHVKRDTRRCQHHPVGSHP